MNNVIITTYEDLKKLREGFIEDAIALIDQRQEERLTTTDGGYVTRTEAAHILKIRPSAVHYRAKKGIITEKKLGGRYYYFRKEIEALASFN